MESGTARIGVIFSGGAYVDPRAYSIIAKTLVERYGFAVSIPIYEKDLAIDVNDCSGSDRVFLASKAFPFVEKWILAGHSAGGYRAQFDAWAAMSGNKTENN